MTAHRLKPIALEEVAGVQYSFLLASQKGRYLEAVVSLFMVSPAVTIFKVVNGKDIFYQGKFLDKAVHVYNGGVANGAPISSDEEPLGTAQNVIVPTVTESRLERKYKHKLL